MRVKKGFSIVELLMVITVIGILVGLVAFISSSEIRKSNLASVVKKTAQILRNIRQMAMARGAYTEVRFPSSTGEKIVVVFGLSDTTTISPPDGFFSYLGQSNGIPSTGVPEAGGTFSSPYDNNPVLFTSSGGSLTPGGIYFSDGEKAYAVGIARSGRIKVWKWGGSSWY